jgi:hypothetical protein
LAVNSEKPRHQYFGGVCGLRGVRRSRFHPVRAERRRSVGDQCDVIPNPPGGCVAEYRAISQIRRDVGRRGIRTIVSIAMASWGIACSTDRKKRVLRVPATKLVNPLGSVCRGFPLEWNCRQQMAVEAQIFRASARKRGVLKIAIGWLSPPSPAASVV